MCVILKLSSAPISLPLMARVSGGGVYLLCPPTHFFHCVAVSDRHERMAWCAFSPSFIYMVREGVSDVLVKICFTLASWRGDGSALKGWRSVFLYALIRMIRGRTCFSMDKD